MDASDRLRILASKVNYISIKNSNIVSQNNVNCGTCSETKPASGLACNLSFSTYNLKIQYKRVKIITYLVAALIKLLGLNIMPYF